MLFRISPCFFFLFVIIKRASFFLVLIINKFLLSLFLRLGVSPLFLRPPLAATIILDFSLRLTHAFCYPSSPSCDFLSVSVSLPSSLARSFLRYSSSRIPILSFRPTLYALPFFLSAHTSSSLSYSFSFVPLPPLYRETPLRPLLSSSYATFSRLPLLFALLPLSLSLSLSLFSISRISLIFRLAFHPPSRSCFRSRRLRALFLSPAVVPPLLPLLSARLFLRFPRRSFTKRTLLSSRSIELRSSSSFYLVKFLVPPRPLLPLLLLLRPQSPPFLSRLPSRRSVPLARSHGILQALCVSFFASLYPRLRLSSLSLSFPLSLFLSRGGQELLILCRKLVRGPPDLFGWARMTLILKYYLAPPPPPPRGRARVCPPLPLPPFTSCLASRD